MKVLNLISASYKWLKESISASYKWLKESIEEANSKIKPYTLTIIITYAISMIFPVLVVFNEFETHIMDNGLETNVFLLSFYDYDEHSSNKEAADKDTSEEDKDTLGEDKHNSNEEAVGKESPLENLGFKYARASGVHPRWYLLSKIIESFLPTTITIIGSTLANHLNTKNRTRYSMAILLLTIITMLGMFFMMSSLVSTLIVFCFVLAILIFVSLSVLGKIENEDNVTTMQHKRESSDGRFSG